MSKVIYNKNYNPPKIDNKVYLAYLPHGVDHEIYRPIQKDSEKMIEYNGEKLPEYEAMMKFKVEFFKGKDFKFIVFFNNRNIRRKMPGDIILAFREFYHSLSEEEQSDVCLLMHTAVIDNNGTDLYRVKEDLAPELPIFFTQQKFEPHVLNWLYNFSSVTINMASNEGFGLSTCESIMAGTPIISNVTGGLQDQLGFKNGKNYLDVDKDYTIDWGSNHDKRFKKHGKWAFPIFPSNRSLAGSPPTPYIFDDRCAFEDAGKAILEAYKLGNEELKKRGLEGRKFATDINVRMTAQMMGESFIDGIDGALEHWKPKERFTLIKIEDGE